MSVPTLAASSTFATGTTSVAVNAPTGTVAGDLLIASVYFEPGSEATGSAAYGTVTPPSGWTEITAVSVNSNDANLTTQDTQQQHTYYKWLTATASGTFTWSVSPADTYVSVSGVLAIRGATDINGGTTGQPYLNQNATAISATNSVFPTTSFTTTATCMLVFMGTSWNSRHATLGGWTGIGSNGSDVWTILDQFQSSPGAVSAAPSFGTSSADFETATLLSFGNLGASNSLTPPPPRLPLTLGPKSVGPTFFAALPTARPGSSNTVWQSAGSATLSFTGSATRPLVSFTRSLPSAALSFSGTLVYLLVYLLAAALSFAGAVPRIVTRALAGALSFTGAVLHIPLRALTAGLSFAGAQARQITHLGTGALSFAGAQSRHVAFFVTAALTLAGVQARSVARAITAALTFTGAIARSKIELLTAALTFAGAQTKRVGRAASAGLSFAGTMPRAIGDPLTGVLSFTGAQTRAIVDLLSGALSFAGNTTRRVVRTLPGAVLSLSGAIARSTLKVLNGALSFSARQLRRITAALAAIQSFAGNLQTDQAGRFIQGLSAALSFTTPVRPLAFLTHAWGASLSLTGLLTRRASRSLAATQSFAGAIVRLRALALAGTLTFAGSYVRATTRHAVASLTPNGALSRRVAHGLLAGLGFAPGLVNPGQPTLLSAILSLTGQLVSVHTTPPILGTPSLALYRVGRRWVVQHFQP